MDADSLRMPPNKQSLGIYTSPCDHDGATALTLPSVIPALASLVDRHIVQNGARKAATGGREPDAPSDARARAFESGTVLDMSTEAFLGRFSRYTQVSPQVYIVAYVYLDRLCRGGGGTGVRVGVVATNAQRLLTTAVLVASKFVEDMNYKNSYFAAVGGLSTAELNTLEIDFLFLVQFKLNVTASVFRSYCRCLEREASVRHGEGRRVERGLRLAASICAAELSSKEAHSNGKSSSTISSLEFVSDVKAIAALLPMCSVNQQM